MNHKMLEYKSHWSHGMSHMSSVTVWLNQLQTSIEVESLNALQAKSVATTPQSFQAFLIRDSQITVQDIRKKSSEVIDGLDYFIDQIPITNSDINLMKSHFLQIMAQMNAIIRTIRRKSLENNQNHKKLIEWLSKNSQQINKMIDFLSTESINNSKLESSLRKLKEVFGELINQVIKNECKVIAEAVHKRTGMLPLKWSLLACCCLAESDGYICRIFTEFHNIVNPLVKILTNESSVPTIGQQIKAISLRVLTILCINRETTKTLVNECIYSQFLTNIITTHSSDLVIKEAIDLMVQLTKPLIDCSHSPLEDNLDVLPQLVINDFIHCLTKVIKTTDNPKVFLLICATIANISFKDITSLVQNQVLNLIVDKAMKTNTFDDIFIRDQMTTILANICRKYPLEIVSSGGMVYLLKSLQLKADKHRNEELMALERIQQKVSVAIARLAGHQSISHVFFRLNVVQRLIEICKQPKERNFNDNVLIAAIAALKRLANSADIVAVKTSMNQ